MLRFDIYDLISPSQIQAAMDLARGQAGYLLVGVGAAFILFVAFGRARG